MSQSNPELPTAVHGLPAHLSFYPSISHSSEASEDSLQPSRSVRKHSPRTSKVKQKHRFGAQRPRRVTKKEAKNTWGLLKTMKVGTQASLHSSSRCQGAPKVSQRLPKGSPRAHRGSQGLPKCTQKGIQNGTRMGPSSYP